jgi:3-deoxy-D-manno-octulosonic-acid transferase
LVKDSEELSSQLNNLFADESIKEQMVSGARRVMQKNKGSIDNIMKLIGPLIKA